MTVTDYSRKKPMYPEGSIITSYIQHLSTLVRASGNRMYGAKLSLSSTEWPILAIVVRENAITVGQICDRLGRDKAHISRDIAALAKRGLIRKRRAASDGRHIVVEFAEEAEGERQAFIDIMGQRSEILITGLDGEDVEALKRILIIMIRNAHGMRDTSF